VHIFNGYHQVEETETNRQFANIRQKRKERNNEPLRHKIA